jgi:hypothetical protein
MDDSRLKARKIVFIIILLGIFLFLAIFITFNMINIYQENRQESDKLAEKSFDCSLLSFEVLGNTVSYENDILQFQVRNRIGEPFETLVVDTGDELYKFKLFDFRSGTEPKTIKIENVIITKEVYAYPDECEEIKKRVR